MRRVAGVLFATALGLLATGRLAAQDPGAATASNAPRDDLRVPPRPATVRGAFTLVSIGDLLYSHPMAERPDPALHRVIDLIRSGTVTIANREGVTLDPATHAAGHGDGLLWAEGSLARDEKAMGIDMVSLANNHGMDWGPDGLADTIRLHRAEGIVAAGGGGSLDEACRAGILDTPQGRVALISTASTFKADARANDALGRTADRPGICTLRTRTVRHVDAAQLRAITALATQFASPLKPAPASGATDVTLGDQLYRLSEAPGLAYDMDLFDHARLLREIGEAKKRADLVVFTIHAHESATGTDDDTPAPAPDFLVTLFHDAVDAGADVVMGGGPHSLRGVEIYKRRPILYGLGAFFINGEVEMLQESAQRVFPDATGHAPPPPPVERSVRPGGNPASWYDGIVAVTEFEGGRARRLRLYPLDLGNTYDRSRRGIPHFAAPEQARRILAALEVDSRQFGTRISIEGSTGVIDIR